MQIHIRAAGIMRETGFGGYDLIPSWSSKEAASSYRQNGPRFVEGLRLTQKLQTIRMRTVDHTFRIIAE